MGIRFHCPNGHKLNVKAFLAGKKGVCPDCGVKLRIPDRSEPELDSGIDQVKPGDVKPAGPQKSASAPAPTPAPTPASAPALASRPATVMTAPAAVGSPVARPTGIATPVMPVGGYPMQSAPPPMPAGPMPIAPIGAPGPYPAPLGRGPLPPPPPVPPPPPPGALDPIAENPLATWFVRPPSGGQFGPARGEVMRKWLTEGRVTADSLVWREGWIDWLAATEVFPQLGKSVAPPGAMFGVTTTAVRPVSGANATPAPRKPASSSLSVAILVGLAIVCVLLVGVLAVVLSGGFGST